MKRRGPRLAFQSVTILLLIGTALLVLGPVREEISRRIETLRTEAIGQLESILGRRVSYQRISPSILNFLNVRGLVVHGREGEAEDLLRVDQLRLYYRPLRLIRGQFASAFSQVRIENSSVSLDLREEDAIRTAIEDVFGQQNGGTADVPQELSIRGENLRVDVASNSGDVSLGDFFFTTEFRGSTLSFDSEGELSLSSDLLPVQIAGGSFSGAGTVDLETGSTLAEVGLQEVSTELARLSEIFLQIRLESGVLEVRNVQSRQPIDIYVRRTTDTEELYARVLADGYVIGDLVEFEGALSALNPFLRFPVQGQASITVTGDGATYGGSLSTGVGAVAGLPGGRFTVRVSGDENELDVDTLEFISNSGVVSYRGVVGLDPLIPQGTVVIDALQIRDEQPITTEFRFVPTGGGFSLDADPFVLAGTRIEEIGWQVSYAEAANSEFLLATGRRAQSRLSISSSHDRDWRLREAVVQADQLDVSSLAASVRGIAPRLAPDFFSSFPQNLRVGARGRVAREEQLVASLSEFRLYDAANPQNSLSLLAQYDGTRLSVSSIDGKLERQTLVGDIGAEQTEAGGIDISADLQVTGTLYQLDGTVTDERIEVRGSRGASLVVRTAGDGPAIIEAQGSVPLPSLDSTDGNAQFSIEGFYRSAESWQFDVESLDLQSISIGPLEGASIELAGTFAHDGATVDRLSYEDAYSRLAGEATASWDLNAGQGSIDLTVVPVLSDGTAVENPDELYRVVGELSADGLSARGELSSVPLARLGIDAVRGSVNVEVTANGTLADPVIGATVSLADARFNNDPVELSLDVGLERELLTVRSGQARIGRTRAEGLQGELDVAEDSVSFSGQLLQVNDRNTVVIAVSAAGSFDDLSGFAGIATTPVEGTLLIEGLPGEQGPTNWALDFSRDALSARIAGGPGDAVEIILSEDGSFSGRAGGDLPVSFEAIGYLEAGVLEADLIDVRADLQRLWGVLALDPVDFTSGTGRGSLRVVGPLNDPDFFGTLVVTDIQAEVEWVPGSVGPGRTFIVFEEKVLTVRETTLAAGTGAARVGAVITLDRWGVEEFLVSVETVPESPLPIDTSFGRIEIDGQASGRLEVTGGRVTTAIDGNLTASNTSITLGPAPDTPPEPDPSRDVTADVTLQTGRGVEFLWPTEAFPILRGFADTDERVRIVFDSSGGSFGVDGDIAIQGGEIFYFDRSFYISEGAIIFAEDEAEFDPRVSVNAEIREVSDEGPVTIFLIADERPLSEFTPQWRSDPPLGEAAILALLGGTVFVGESGDPLDFSQAVLLTSDLVSQFGLIRSFESSVREALNLDLFSIRTQLFQNLLRGVIDQNESVPLDSTVPSLGEYLDNTTLFVGRYLGTDLFLELLVQVRQAETDVLGQQSLTGIEIDSEVSLEWETPFFQLEWAFFPRDPSSLFLADNTIRFSWDYTY